MYLEISVQCRESLIYNILIQGLGRSYSYTNIMFAIFLKSIDSSPLSQWFPFISPCSCHHSPYLVGQFLVESLYDCVIELDVEQPGWNPDRVLHLRKDKHGCTKLQPNMTKNNIIFNWSAPWNLMVIDGTDFNYGICTFHWINWTVLSLLKFLRFGFMDQTINMKLLFIQCCIFRLN